MLGWLFIRVFNLVKFYTFRHAFFPFLDFLQLSVYIHLKIGNFRRLLKMYIYKPDKPDRQNSIMKIDFPST